MERLWMVPSYMILTLIVLGTLAAFTGIVTPFRGFSFVFLGVVTSVVFGIAVSLIAVFEGYDCVPTAEGVSRAITRTVVSSALAILALDFILTSFMFRG